MTEETVEVTASEAAANLAEEHDVDLAEVEGTGAGGNITKGDVEKYIKENAADTDEDSDEDEAAPEPVEVVEEKQHTVKGRQFTYIGGGADSPRVINYMGVQKFVRGQLTEVTDPTVLNKIVKNQCFVEGEVGQEELHEIDQEAEKAQNEQIATDTKINNAFKRRHGGE